ncbi:hypothetical protein SAMN02910358_00436 [Lachnospiraceae bacterium XBB1006]|nr:hypothetical protein SAMN02910358_00436 [Lachnospiraceae bacterium XBB1006]
MNQVYDMLDTLQKKALRDSQLRDRLLATEHSEEPIKDFCDICQEMGFELYPMELVLAGEDFQATMKRSTNGGGENSPMLASGDDLYGLFIAAIAK